MLDLNSLFLLTRYKTSLQFSLINDCASIANDCVVSSMFVFDNGKHHREMLLAMSVVVLEVVTLILQRVARFIFHLPACPATPHEWVDITLAYPQVRHPTEVLHLVLAHLPVLDEIDPHVCSRAIERHVVDKAKPMHQPSSAVMPLIAGDAPRCFGRLHLLE